MANSKHRTRGAPVAKPFSLFVSLLYDGIYSAKSDARNALYSRNNSICCIFIPLSSFSTFFSLSLSLSVFLSFFCFSIHARVAYKKDTHRYDFKRDGEREREREREIARNDFYSQVRKALLISLISALSNNFSFTTVRLLNVPFLSRNKVYQAKTALDFGLKREACGQLKPRWECNATDDITARFPCVLSSRS